MKYVAALPLAAVFAIGLATGAQAWGVVPHEYKAPATDVYYGYADTVSVDADTAPAWQPANSGPRVDTRNVYYKPAHGPRGR